jgi:hypothetical protein
MNPYLALVIGLILGAIIVFFLNLLHGNRALDDAVAMTDELRDLRSIVDGLEEREDKICQQCIDDTVKQFQANAERMSSPDIVYAGDKGFANFTPFEDDPIG